jgi:hypothetical protein
MQVGKPLRIARRLWSAGIRVETEGAQLGSRVGPANHRKRTRIVLSIERSSRARKVAVSNICGIIEPEADLEGINRRQSRSGIEAKYLIDQDSMDRCRRISESICFNIGLIPGEAKVSRK